MPTSLEIRQMIAAGAERKHLADAQRDMTIAPAGAAAAAAPTAPTAAQKATGVPCPNCGGSGYAPASVAAEANRQSKIDQVTATDR